jgi:HlyD family secretion protein
VQELFQKGYVAASDVDTARATAEVNTALLASAKQTLNLTRAKAATSVATARAGLEQAKASLAAAEAGRAQNAVKREQVAEAQATVTQSQASYAQSRSELDKTYIRTPISGTVTQLAQQEGETIAAGLSAPTVIIVTDLTRLQVDVYVDETDIGQVRLGQEASVTVDAYPKHPFAGKVVKVASGSTTQNNVVTYDVTIALNNPGNLLRPDMTATANIVVTGRKHVLTVPVDAVKTGAEGPSVTVMEQGPGGKPTAKVVSVKTGVSDGDRTEILSGLEEGATIVVSGTAVPTGDGGPRMPGMFGFGGGRGGGGRGR